jgi:mono/diheme cytochrome c family protein
MFRHSLNLFLFVMILASLGLYALLGGSSTQRNFEIMPEMAHSIAYTTFAPNPNFRDGKTLQAPQVGTIPRGRLPIHYGTTPQEAVRAGMELQNPFAQGNGRARERGAFIYVNYCRMCHGDEGKGDGPLPPRGIPPPASLLADRTVAMKDGQLFHVVTYGQGNMPAHAAQLSQDDRWQVVLHLRSLQQAAKEKKPS